MFRPPNIEFCNVNWYKLKNEYESEVETHHDDVPHEKTKNKLDLPSKKTSFK